MPIATRRAIASVKQAIPHVSHINHDLIVKKFITKKLLEKNCFLPLISLTFEISFENSCLFQLSIAQSFQRARFTPLRSIKRDQAGGKVSRARKQASGRDACGKRVHKQWIHSNDSSCTVVNYAHHLNCDTPCRYVVKHGLQYSI